MKDVKERLLIVFVYLMICLAGLMTYVFLNGLFEWLFLTPEDRSHMIALVISLLGSGFGFGYLTCVLHEYS